MIVFEGKRKRAETRRVYGVVRFRLPSPPSFPFQNRFNFENTDSTFFFSPFVLFSLSRSAVGGATSNNTRAPGSKILNVTVPSSIEQVDAFLASSDGAKSKLGRSLHIILVGQNNIAANPAATGAGELLCLFSVLRRESSPSLSTSQS